MLLFFLPSPLPAEEAAANYSFYCAPCHGLLGRGDGVNATDTQPVGPRDHTNRKEMSALTDEDIVNVIKWGGASVGRSTLMPPFGKTLTDKEVLELKGYLRELCKCRQR